MTQNQTKDRGHSRDSAQTQPHSGQQTSQQQKQQGDKTGGAGKGDQPKR